MVDESTESEITVRQRRQDSSLLALDTIEKNTVGTKAIESIKQLIITGALKPGGALPAERDLAAMLGISRPTLREVISALCAMNVLESRHGAGTFVTSPHLTNASCRWAQWLSPRRDAPGSRSAIGPSR